ncbi:SPL family radical SAM protein [Spirochaeta africana]|uniref:DNA repair photolyase n=1 Tax=Spirochaeta africana (strain ATCC 700263 / DSM 8902 / Z-7692) TaxID=889378 RepID=H9UIF8_SPIAZ|nr:deoxyribodipyrimidine photo-lyase [Spirochaeta africana]AFG37301.1 DNA repair photolyase [Spirochaeta africana DSM 8902]
MKISRIYFEHAAADHPRTRALRERFAHLPQIGIPDYKTVFNRPNQRFQVQKQAQALILAQKPMRLYEATERVDSFHRSVPVHFVDPVRNCVYNCDYCFLQGMHSSGHLLYFVNHDEAAGQALQAAAQQPIYLSISYLTDLLGMEDDLGVCRDWIQAVRGRPDITVEIRTKSENYPSLRRLAAEMGGPPQNVLLVWSLSPAAIAARYERGTASFQGRLAAARLALQEGWRVRLCLDPIIRVPDWEAVYRECIRHTFARLDPARIEQLSFGVFRLGADFLRRLRESRQDSSILYHPFEVADGLATYQQQAIDEMQTAITDELSQFLQPSQYKFVHG